MPKMQFGKYAGMDISEVPDSYLVWMKKDAQEKIDMCDKELLRRAAKVDDSFMLKIVNTGYRELVNSLAGATPEESARLSLARDKLEEAIRDAAQVPSP